jgi:hypothetical protein
MDLTWFFTSYRRAIHVLLEYRKALLIFTRVYVILGGISLYGFLGSPEDERNTNFTPYLPVQGLFVEPMLGLLVCAVTAILGALVGGYALSPLYLVIHKLLYRKMIYGVQEVPPPETFKGTLNGWYPTLLAFHINSILLLSNKELSSRILTAEAVKLLGQDMMVNLVASMILLMLTLALGVMVFSPIWFLLDAGIVYSTKKHVRGMGRPFEVRAVGGWFHDYLRGYAGFGVALSFILILLEYIGPEIAQRGLVANLSDISWMFGLPVFITLTVIPAHIVLDITREHRIGYVRKVARATGITDTVSVSYQRSS